LKGIFPVTDDFHQLIETAFRKIALQAGAVIMEVYARPDFEARAKSDNSPVTEADEAADAVIRAELAKDVPEIAVVTEEAAETHTLRADRFIIVDPLDGTKEFVQRRGDFTVNIALVENGVPALGILYAPQLDTLFAGAAGTALRGSIHAGDKFAIDSATPIRARPRPEKLTALVSRTHPDPKGEEFLARLPIGQKTPLGSSLKFARLAEGAADIYARLAPINEWDIGAGYALLTAAGGEVTAPDGSPISFGTREDGFGVEGFVAWGAPRDSGR
jgi:3'(2'), 5'-bisphosphate nucleotidase